MRVLEIYRNFLPTVGGVQTYIHDLCRCLLDRKDKPVVLTWGPSRPSFEVIDDICVHRFCLPLIFRATRYPAIFYLSSQIASLVRRYDIDVIHAHSYFSGLASALAGNFLRKPVVVTFHAPMWFWPNLELPAYVSPLEPFLKKYFINSVDCIICNSNFTRQESLKLGFPASKLKVIYNWVTLFPECDTTSMKEVLRRFNLVRKRFILSVGRLSDREKGFSILIHALNLLMSRGYALDLVIVGSGPDMYMLRKYAHSLGIEDHVHFLGSMIGKDLACLYKACDVFALASYFEAFGLAQLEAISVGKPVVSTKVGGIPEVIRDGYNGMLVDLKPSAFASAIEKLESVRHLKEIFAKRSTEIVSEKFSRRNCHTIISLLEELLGK